MGGSVQNRSSTHLNICAAFSALKRPKEVGRMLSFVVRCRQRGAISANLVHHASWSASGPCSPVRARHSAPRNHVLPRPAGAEPRGASHHPAAARAVGTPHELPGTLPAGCCRAHLRCLCGTRSMRCGAGSAPLMPVLLSLLALSSHVASPPVPQLSVPCRTACPCWCASWRSQAPPAHCWAPPMCWPWRTTMRRWSMRSWGGCGRRWSASLGELLRALLQPRLLGSREAGSSCLGGGQPSRTAWQGTSVRAPASPSHPAAPTSSHPSAWATRHP